MEKKLKSSGYNVFKGHPSSSNGIPGGYHDLIQHLWDEYGKQLSRDIEARRESGKASVSLDEAKKRAPAVAFVEWASDYLRTHRADRSFGIEGNIGLQFMNGQMVALCPGGDSNRGMMRDSSVPITFAADS